MSKIVTHNRTVDKHLSFEQETQQINELSDSTLMEIEAFDTAYILRLTKAALIAGNIPEGDTLVPFIGHGCESNNSQAVENWIRGQIHMLVEIAPQGHIEKIIEDIDNRLTDVKTNYLNGK